MVGPCDFSVSPSPFGLDFGTLDFGTTDSGLTILYYTFMVYDNSSIDIISNPVNCLILIWRIQWRTLWQIFKIIDKFFLWISRELFKVKYELDMGSGPSAELLVQSPLKRKVRVCVLYTLSCLVHKNEKSFSEKYIYSRVLLKAKHSCFQKA